MKKTIIFPVLLILTVFLSSCGFNAAIISNHNQNATEVQLNSNNFKVIDQVSGSSEVSYIFGIGGTDKRQLYENAYSDMMKKANLMNGSKAIVNVMTEEQVSGFAPFFIRRTVTVSAHVVEFTR
jgi:regulatory protein YycI of two-component signal transduction system YycFG